MSYNQPLQVELDTDTDLDTDFDEKIFRLFAVDAPVGAVDVTLSRSKAVCSMHDRKPAYVCICNNIKEL
ncbi:MAG: hypothetical protein HGA97_10835 [Chlorobiaceae bacterium]|nr:hypothetical protein [Chlorobiaceae bacterium]